MKLRGIEFGNVWAGSGVMGYFGEGYWYHHTRASEPFGLDFTGMTLVSKTATEKHNPGNMPFDLETFQPLEKFPDCIKVRPLSGITLNAVGVANPGIDALLAKGEWQALTKPFVISIMAIEEESEQKRLDEIKYIVHAIGERQDEFNAPFAIQENISCPNTNHSQIELTNGIADRLEVQSELGVPLIPKVSIAAAPTWFMMELNDNDNVDAICSSNTVGYDWRELGQWHWKLESPMRKYNKAGGGLGGKVLRKLTCEWIEEVRDAGFTKPINGGGGILTKRNIRQFRRAGADSVFFASAAMVRPHRVRKLIRYGNKLDFTRR